MISSQISKRHQICCAMGWTGMGTEMNILTRELGYDALMIRELAWQNWDYYPQDVGVQWNKLDDPTMWPPKTIAVYTASMVSGFELYRDERIYDREEVQSTGTER